MIPRIPSSAGVWNTSTLRYHLLCAAHHPGVTIRTVSFGKSISMPPTEVFTTRPPASIRLVGYPLVAHARCDSGIETHASRQLIVRVRPWGECCGDHRLTRLDFHAVVVA